MLSRYTVYICGQRITDSYKLGLHTCVQAYFLRYERAPLRQAGQEEMGDVEAGDGQGERPCGQR